MLRTRVILATVGTILGLAACDRGAPAPPEPPQATDGEVVTVVPVQPGATTRPATTRSTPSVLTIAGAEVEFPPARLRLREKDAAMSALLFTDDPPTAIDRNYTGNSYYLNMPLNVAAVEDLPAHKWVYQAPSEAEADSPNGIFLEGNKRELRPLDVTVDFREVSDNRALVHVEGKFVLLATEPNVQDQVVDVTGELEALIQ